MGGTSWYKEEACSNTFTGSGQQFPLLNGQGRDSAPMQTEGVLQYTLKLVAKYRLGVLKTICRGQKLNTVKFGALYVPDSHPTPSFASSVFGGFSLVCFFWSVWSFFAFEALLAFVALHA